MAAAADLETTLTELGPLYRRDTGREVVFSFGSSGLLARQIAQGAPYDLFCAASADYVDGLVKQGRIDPGSRTPYARGRLCLLSRQGGPSLAGLEDLTRKDVERIAIANPEHAPYGRAAVAALRSAGIYDQVKDRLVFGENVRQAMQYAESGNVEAALVACSLVPRGATLLAARRLGPAVELPEALHGPILQVLGVVRGGDEGGARHFVALLLSPAGRDMLRRHGFGEADGTPTP